MSSTSLFHEATLALQARQELQARLGIRDPKDLRESKAMLALLDLPELPALLELLAPLDPEFLPED
jgi:hypothetical protein